MSDQVIKFITEAIKKLERGIDSGRKNFNRVENPEISSNEKLFHHYYLL